MGGRGKHDLGTVRNGLYLESTVRLVRRVSPQRGRICPIGTGDPEVLVGHGIAVDIIPAAVQDQTGVRDCGKPFVGVVKGQLPQVIPVRSHSVQRVYVPPRAELRTETPRVSSPARGGENDIAVGKVCRHEVVVRPLGNLPQVRAIHTDLVDVVETFVRLIV